MTALDNPQAAGVMVGGNLYTVVERGARLFAEHTAVVSDGLEVSYAGLRRRIRVAAGELTEFGVEPGDRVISLTPNTLEAVVLAFAVAYVGAVSVPLNSMLQSAEITALVDRVEPVIAFTHETYADKVAAATAGRSIRSIDLVGDRGWTAGRDGPETSSHFVTTDGPAAIVFTSGSSSAPKGCVKSHANYLWSAVNHQMSWPRTPDDRELYAIPLSGIGFANLVMGPMLGGATVVLERFHPVTTLDAMAKWGTTTTFLPATMLDSLLQEESRSGRRDLSAMRQIQASYSMSDRLRRRIADRFPNIVHFSYGLTEGAMSSAREPDRFLSDPTCVGQPCGIDAFSIVDPGGKHLGPGELGEIVVAGPDVMLGYLDDAAATEAALKGGWLHTGDLGRLDDSGSLHFEGRLKDLIKTGGVNVAAAEVEHFLTTHVDVHDAAVIGVPDDHWGEAVTAFVQPVAGAVVTPHDLGDFCRDGLAGFKQPKTIHLVDELPRNPGGKVAKDQLRAMTHDRELATAEEG